MVLLKKAMAGQNKTGRHGIAPQYNSNFNSNKS